jgi:hypothetical protein
MMKTLQQDLDLWEVWIEYDQFHPEYFGTLYVHGEILSDKRASSQLTKIDKGGCQLRLQLPSRASGPNFTKEVLYSEPIRNLNQYTSVCLYAGEKVVAYFSNIEIMI